MKKNVLALSIAAMIGGLGFAGAASAAVIDGSATGAYDGSLMTPSDATGLQFSEGGVGHQLLVPYYTVQDGNMTVIHLVNTDTNNGKAVKVRFRFTSDSSINDDGWYIDDIRLLAGGQACRDSQDPQAGQAIFADGFE